MKTFARATRLLQRRLGSRVDTSREGCWAASFDSSKISFLPEAVITPRREAEVGVVLTLANELKRRGGGSGAAALCGGGGQGDALIITVPAQA